MKRQLILIILLLLVLLIDFIHAVAEFKRNDFPPDFVFGSGSSAYQVEGAAFDDGRTPSIWDTFAHSDIHGANGDVACDVYHKYKEDIQLMVDMGLEAFRFSISWSRLIPNGRGAVNPKGLQFYNNFINELIHHDIQPHVTLFHYDLPQILEEEYGGWLSQNAVKDFVAYANVCFREFGDRVSHWTTFNEANVFAIGGYDNGDSAPGRCSSHFGLNCTKGNSSTEPYIVLHHILLAHASAARLYFKKYKATQKGMIGMNVFCYWLIPHTNSIEDKNATQRGMDFLIGWVMNPLLFGDYPEILKERAGVRIPVFTKLESNLVKGSFDFIGVNHYYSLYVKDQSTNVEMEKRDFLTDMKIQLISIQEDIPPDEFPIFPLGLYKLLEYFKHVYGNPPVYIHENGQKSRRNGTLEDTSRVKYLHGYVGGLLDALRNGSDTRGYFMWSFLDSFELLDGYNSAYGLYYVDLDDKDLRRYPKLSSQWYSNFLKGGNTSLHYHEVIQVAKNPLHTAQIPSHLSQ